MELGGAVSQLKRTFGHAADRQPHPSNTYFFIIGAGVSAPEVPLAHEIERRCRTVIDDEHITDEIPADGNAMQRYSCCLQAAYPHPRSRQEFFQQLIAGRAISPANFRLAHLLESGRVPRLVVTPNFDDFLSRALSLFGAAHIVCDHPMTTERIDPERLDEIQLFHVHGTYWFYDCCNLDGEIRQRANPGKVHQTVASRLDQILANRSPIVLGYSGWEDDVLMTALKRRLTAPHPLPYLLYWFCYRRDAVDVLPAFLTEHPQVRLVLPPEGQSEPVRGDGAGIRDLRAPGIGDAAPESTSPPIAVLEAVTVLDELIRALEVEAPRLTQNPIGFFADQLRASLPTSSVDREGGDDIYRLAHLVNRLDGMRESWRLRSESGSPLTSGSTRLVRVQDALRRSQYREAVSAAEQISLDELTFEELRELHETSLLAARHLKKEPHYAAVGYQVAIAAADALMALDQAQEGELAPATAAALVDLGTEYNVLRAYDRAEAACTTVITRWGASPVPGLQLATGRALGTIANAMSETGRLHEAITHFQQAYDQCAHSDDPRFQTVCAKALNSKAAFLARAGDHLPAVKVFTQVVELYSDSPHQSIRLEVAQSLTDMSASLKESGDVDGALEKCDTVIERFGNDLHPDFEASVAQAFVLKGWHLTEAAREADAITVYDEFFARFGDPQNSALNVLAATALLNKAWAVARLNRIDDAIGYCDDFVARYGGERDPEIRIRLAQVLVNRASYLLQLERPAEALATSESGLVLCRSLVHPVVDLLLTCLLLAQARSAFALGNVEQARTTLQAVLDRDDDPADPRQRSVVDEARRVLADIA